MPGLQGSIVGLTGLIPGSRGHAKTEEEPSKESGQKTASFHFGRGPPDQGALPCLISSPIARGLAAPLLMPATLGDATPVPGYIVLEYLMHLCTKVSTCPKQYYHFHNPVFDGSHSGFSCIRSGPSAFSSWGRRLKT